MNPPGLVEILEDHELGMVHVIHKAAGLTRILATVRGRAAGAVYGSSERGGGQALPDPVGAEEEIGVTQMG
jgi:hypothetical protein